MANRDPEFDAYVLKIHAVLERLDYYRLLGVDTGARVPQVKKAFYGIAAKFHPDRNRDAHPKVKMAIYDIFKRLNEAYRVLCDPERRTAYDTGLKCGETRLKQENRRTSAPQSPEDTIKSREARQFFRQAGEALKTGNIMQAELHIKVAKAREIEPNAVIESLFAQVQVAKDEKKKKK